MFRLRTHTVAPPGAYPYEQTQGIRRKFKSVPDINNQARAVMEFRQGNGLERASFEEALQDVDEYQCQRLGNMDRWCHSPDAPYVETTPKLRRSGCSGCGAKVK